MLDYAAKLSLEPWNMDESDVQSCMEGCVAAVTTLGGKPCLLYTSPSPRD